MYFKLLTFVLLAACVKAADQDPNKLCPCDTEESIKDNEVLKQFLLELIPDGDLTQAQKELASVYPGLLYQLGCGRCDEKLRKKRKIMPEPESTEDTEVEYHVKRPQSHFGNNCPTGYKKISFLCIPEEDIDDYGDDN